MGFNRGGFNRAKFNSTEFSNVLYCESAANTSSEGTVTACIDFYTAGVSDTITVGSAISKLLKQLAFEYSGELAAGKKVCVNATNFTVTLNRINAIDKFDGKFPEVFPVSCTVEYADGEASRTVKVIVSRRDRKV